jgi:hypothetical protein
MCSRVSAWEAGVCCYLKYPPPRLTRHSDFCRHSRHSDFCRRSIHSDICRNRRHSVIRSGIHRRYFCTSESDINKFLLVVQCWLLYFKHTPTVPPTASAQLHLTVPTATESINCNIPSRGYNSTFTYPPHFHRSSPQCCFGCRLSMVVVVICWIM